MRYIPTEKELQNTIKLVQIEVTGEYIARIDEARRTSKRYTVNVLVPEKYTLSDIKRQTPKALIESKDYADFMTMRTFEETGTKAKKTDKTVKLIDTYSQRERDRFTKLRKHIKDDAKEEKKARKGGPGIAQDDSEYDDETGLPHLVNG